MSSVNKAILIGNLGSDPEVRVTQNGSKIVTFNLATSERWKSKDGTQNERTEWHRIVIFSEALGDVAERFLKKGSKVYIEGSLQTRKWTDKDGNNRASTEVVLSKYRGELQMLDPKPQGQVGNNSFTTQTTLKVRPEFISEPLDDEIPY